MYVMQSNSHSASCYWWQSLLVLSTWCLPWDCPSGEWRRAMEIPTWRYEQRCRSYFRRQWHSSNLARSEIHVLLGRKYLLGNYVLPADWPAALFLSLLSSATNPSERFTLTMRHNQFPIAICTYLGTYYNTDLLGICLSLVYVTSARRCLNASVLVDSWHGHVGDMLHSI